MRLHRHQQKDKIICEARAKRSKLQYRGTPIFIYEDYAPEVMEQRYKYSEVLAELYNSHHQGLTPALLFPARLSIMMRFFLIVFFWILLLLSPQDTAKYTISGHLTIMCLPR